MEFSSNCVFRLCREEIELLCGRVGERDAHPQVHGGITMVGGLPEAFSVPSEMLMASAELVQPGHVICVETSSGRESGSVRIYTARVGEALALQLKALRTA